MLTKCFARGPTDSCLWYARVSVVIVILGVTFLEHFIRWEQPMETLQFGAGMALAVGVLVLFQH